MLPTPLPCDSPFSDQVLSVLRLEAWYRCSRCTHSFFRNLSPNATCPNARCRHRAVPCAERVQDGRVISAYRCIQCQHAWTLETPLNKSCNLCGSEAQPRDLQEACGIAYGQCRACSTVTYKANGGIGTPIPCRRCQAVGPATAVCSNLRREHIQRTPGLDVLATIRASAYVPLPARLPTPPMVPT